VRIGYEKRYELRDDLKTDAQLVMVSPANHLATEKVVSPVRSPDASLHSA
jgi:hypothetical protein